MKGRERRELNSPFFPFSLPRSVPLRRQVGVRDRQGQSEVRDETFHRGNENRAKDG